MYLYIRINEWIVLSGGNVELKNKDNNQTSGWASLEFGDANLGDSRLNDRLIKLADRLATSPESPINQACRDWGETKAAYRFFQNEKVSVKNILASHVSKTVDRSMKSDTTLAIQDTSYFSYTSHKKNNWTWSNCKT